VDGRDKPGHNKNGCDRALLPKAGSAKRNEGVIVDRFGIMAQMPEQSLAVSYYVV
jgi:hypothetical protein